MTNTPLWRAVSALGTRDPATPLWRGVIVLRVTTLLFALGSFIVHYDGYAKQWLAWVAFGVMTAWTVLSSVFYARPSSRWPWLVGVDLAVTVVLMFTSAWVLSTAQFDANTPLITTVWAAVPPAVAGTRFGALGGVFAGLVVSVVTGLVRWRFDVDVARDGFLLTASGFVIGLAATMARRSADALTRALRMEAATAERERLARSIHDSVLQVLARVRKRGAEFGGEAAELAKLAGEQEIALRALVTTEPTRPSANGTTDLRAALQLLATPSVQVSTPAGEVRLPEHVTAELVAVAREALLNVEKHAGPEAHAWVLLEDLGTEVVVSVRDDGPGIEPGELERAAAEGHLGIAESIKGRVRDLGGSIALDTAPGQGTEWEVKVPVAARGKR
ncbi:MacS family sensor histidine kinase [Amycolatopsis sp. cmx-11-12]|uniref:MacS family sensor histidine kinase n=1 Tax=Amycolatopsis sp. cmx-11-12 TaxID=2785795 RepID=UPI0039170B99